MSATKRAMSFEEEEYSLDRATMLVVVGLPEEMIDDFESLGDFPAPDEDGRYYAPAVYAWMHSCCDPEDPGLASDEEDFLDNVPF